MFHRIRQYELIQMDEQWYRPRAYGDPQLDGTWDGWLVFFTVDGRSAIAPPSRETTQSTLQALTTWADGLRPVYLEGALARALELERGESYIIARLAQTEYEALEAADDLEHMAQTARAVADDAGRRHAAQGDAPRRRASGKKK